MGDYTEIPNNELEIYTKMSKDFKIVFDVGCRDDLDFYNIKQNVEYHLFEPFTDALNSIKNKINSLPKNKLILNEFGLSDKNSDDCVYYSNTQSFIPHWYVPPIDSGERYSLRTLDTYVKDNKIDNIDFIKIDVEGLDYNVINGGINTIKTENKVLYIQVEYNGGIKQYVDLLDNFDFYLMVEPNLLGVILNNNTLNLDFNKSLVKLDDNIIDFMDKTISPKGVGGNIFGVNKKLKNNINHLIFKIL
jgi:FkbM family methyltransferase